MKIKFTLHAELRLVRRKLLREEIVESIQFPDKTIKKHGKYVYQKKLNLGTIEVVCEKTEKSLNVITLYWL